MSDFIEDFYYGNIEPQECTTNLTAKVKKSLSELSGKEEHLTSILADKEQELFADYVATYIKFSSLCNADIFTVGFRESSVRLLNMRMMRRVTVSESLVM